MMKRTGMLVVCGALLGAASFASAQDDGLGFKENAFSLKAGFFLPTDNAVSNDSAWFAFGVDYRFHHQLTVDKQHLFGSVSLDYAGHGDVRTVPLLVNVTRYFDQVYVTGGIGASFSRLPGNDDKTRFAFQVGVGYEFKGNTQFPLFVEARFLGTDDSKLNGFGFFGGVRF